MPLCNGPRFWTTGHHDVSASDRRVRAMQPAPGGSAAGVPAGPPVRPARPVTHPVETLARFGTVARDLSELKRMRDHSTADSVAERLFRSAWAALAQGSEPRSVCLQVVADALVATRLGGIDAGLLRDMEVDRQARNAVLCRAFDDAAAALSPDTMAPVRDAVGGLWTAAGHRAPPFVDMLIRQPRAGATSPGRPRLALEPAESQGDHCVVVGVLGALLALHGDADPARAFLAGLAHHLHNARLPDTGFAGEVMLGDLLLPLMRRLTDGELQTLPPALRARVEDALAPIADADTADGRAFNAADVIDRVLQAHHHGRAAAFTVDQALGDLQLVHEGPLQAFHLRVLSTLGLS